MKVNIVFYSMYGHIYRMAEAVAEGARQVSGAEVGLFQVPETLSQEILAKMGQRRQKRNLHIYRWQPWMPCPRQMLSSLEPLRVSG